MSPPATEGQRLLRDVPGSLGDIAKRLDVSRQTVHCWRAGTKAPGPAMRPRLEAAYGIPALSWEQRPGSAAAAPRATAHEPTRPTIPRVLPARQTTLEEVYALLDELDEDAGRDGLMPSELARLRDTKTKALALRARLEAQALAFEAEAVLKHESWHRVRATIVAALRPHPEATRDVVSALSSIEAA